jgi:CheY-like chemotaxis protein
MENIENLSKEEFVFPERKTILVAEDIESNFKLINYFLIRANVDVLRASNGKEAVDIALSNSDIDLILMDLRMPEMDGFTAVKLIREAKIKVPIIAQTAYTDERQRALDIGCNTFITKPFDKNGLLKVITDLIQELAGRF